MPIPPQPSDLPVELRTKYLHIRAKRSEHSKWKRHARACKWSLSELVVNTLNTACDSRPANFVAQK